MGQTPITLLDSRKGKKAGKDQESIQSNTIPDPGYQLESNKLTIDIKNESQEASPFPAGDNKAPISRCAQKHNKEITKKYRLGTVSKNILLESLSQFNIKSTFPAAIVYLCQRSLK